MDSETLLSLAKASSDMPSAGPVIVFAAQSGDEVLGCGGMLCKAASKGVRTLVVIVNRCERGPQKTADYLKWAAEQEPASRSAARVLGYGEPEVWKESSLSFGYCENTVQRISDLISGVAASLVYAPSLVEPLPERFALGLAVREAVRRCGAGCALALYGVDAPAGFANRVLDIGEVFEKKMRAIACFVPTEEAGGASAPRDQQRNPAKVQQYHTSTIEGYDLRSPQSLVDPIRGLSARERWKNWATPTEDALVSVVIRSAGRDELADALDSVAAQTYRAIEVVLVDVEGRRSLPVGGWCGQFPIRMVSTGQHLSRGVAANAGLDAATGDYVVFLDDDDWLLPGHVHVLVSAVRTSRDARAAYAGVECRRRIQGGDWDVLTVFNEPYDPTRLLVENYLPIHAVLFDRELLQAGLRFEESFTVYEDWDFWIQLSAVTPLAHIDRITAIYRISQTSGFGLRSEDPQVDAGYSVLLEKWRMRWTPDQLSAIARHAGHRVREATAAAHRELEAQAATIASLRICVTELGQGVVVQQAHAGELEQAAKTREARIGELEQAAKTREAHIGELEQAAKTREAHIGELEQAATREMRINGLQSELASVRDHKRGISALKNQLLHRLDAIQTSASWQLVRPLHTVESRWPNFVRGIAAVPKLACWALAFRLPQRLRIRRLSTALVANGLFQRSWYVENNPDIVLDGNNPMLHWLVRGWAEGRDPNPLFNTAWYLAQNPDVAAAGLNPLAHYLASGADEGRDPSPLFDTDWYLAQNPDVAEGGLNPLAHYLASGADEGRDPSPLFDTDWYLAQNPDVVAAGLNPLAHYLASGADEGRDPSPLFDTDWYLAQNPDIAAAKMNPLAHYLQYGADEERSPKRPNHERQQFNCHSEGLIDLRTVQPCFASHPDKIAIHVHVYYTDLAQEIAQYLCRVPFEFDLYISTPTAEGREICSVVFRQVKKSRHFSVKVVPNRGRDIAPMMCAFGSELQQYDFICHLHTKKSLYANDALKDWGKYLFSQLIGNEMRVRRIFALFREPDVGIVYSQSFSKLPYWAHTWLSNRPLGRHWCKRLGISSVPEGYFDYPTSSMFWARTSAIRDLLEAGIHVDDFPEESGQTDGTLAHTIERLPVLLARKNGFKAACIADERNPSASAWRIDQYLNRTRAHIEGDFDNPSISVVAFDVFDTLLMRPVVRAETAKQLVDLRLRHGGFHGFLQYRQQAEGQARQAKGRDVDLNDIYTKLQKIADLSNDHLDEIRQLEIAAEEALIEPRPEGIELFRYALALGLRVVLVSDMFLPRPVIEGMLEKCGVTGYHHIYLSNEVGKRKDTAELYWHLLDIEQVKASAILVVGDNEHSDLQLPMNIGMNTCHVLKPVELARALPRFQPVLAEVERDGDLGDELALGLLLKRFFGPISGDRYDFESVVQGGSEEVGYGIGGPMVLGFIYWLIDQGRKARINTFYFLAREGKIFKDVYDRLARDLPDAPGSCYLVLSRRASTVPSLGGTEDIADLAQAPFGPNTLQSFMHYRYGIRVSDDDMTELANRGLWPEDKRVEVSDELENMLRDVLVFFQEKIFSQRDCERAGLMRYLEEAGLLSGEPAAIVDIGYSGTVQKVLCAMTGRPINGYYMLTRQQAAVLTAQYDVFAKGYYGDLVDDHDQSPFWHHSFTAEILFSSDDPQIERYELNPQGQLVGYFQDLSEKELNARKVRAQIHKGILSYVDDAVSLGEKAGLRVRLRKRFALELFLHFASSLSASEKRALTDLKLDDHYCGRGLVGVE